MIRFVKLSETASKVSYEFHSSLGEYGTFDIDKNTHGVSYKEVFDFDDKGIDVNDIHMLPIGIKEVINKHFPDKHTCAWC